MLYSTVLEIEKKYHLSAGQVTMILYLSAKVNTCPNNFRGMRLMAWLWVGNKNVGLTVMGIVYSRRKKRGRLNVAVQPQPIQIYVRALVKLTCIHKLRTVLDRLYFENA